MNAKRDFARGYFCAVAALLHMEGCNTTEVSELFRAGGDWTLADPQDIAAFRAAGLVPQENSSA